MKRQVLTPYINIFENKGMFITGHLSLNIKKNLTGEVLFNF